MRTEAPARPPWQAAFFDVDGTCTDTTVLHYYFWYVRDRLPILGRWWRIGKLLLMIPFYMALDTISRTAFNHAFYRSYAGISENDLDDWSRSGLRARLLPRLFDGAEREIRALRSQSVRIIFVTGSLAASVEPLREAAGAADAPAEVFGVALVSRRGVFSGKIGGAPLAGEEKARRIRDYARKHGIDLHHCAAYGDSMADLPMLQAVGHPVVVNPSARLRRRARQRNWPLYEWPA